MTNPRHVTIRLALLLAAALAPCAQALGPIEDRPVAEREYWTQIENKDWEGAILAAEKLVETARMESNRKPEALAEALVLLGSAQVANRNYLGAEAAYSEALQILQPRVAPTSAKLLDPLRGMGYTLAYAGKHEQAIPYMERALLISRRTHGLFNIHQQNLLRQLAMSLASVGMYAEAEQQMQYLVRVGEQTYGAKDPRMSGIHDQLGDFYMQTGFAGAAREAYRNALAVVEKKLGRNDLATIPPLRAYAQSYRQELLWSQFGIRGPLDRSILANHLDPDNKALNPRYLSADGERALKRALKTLDSHPARPTWLLFDTLLDLGDWYMIKSNPREAMLYYRRAASLLDEVETEHSAAARAKLNVPVQVYYPVPPAATRYLNRPADEVDLRIVHVAFKVTADGSVEDARLVESNASERHAGDTLNAVRSARYRPKFVDGEPVETIDVSLRQVFRMRRERERETE